MGRELNWKKNRKTQQFHRRARLNVTGAVSHLPPGNVSASIKSIASPTTPTIGCKGTGLLPSGRS